MTKDLNRLSAEKIMGWVWSDEHEMWCDGSERDADGRLTFANPDELDWINDDPDELGQQAPWTPLTDLNQCFQVVEKLEKERGEVIVRKFMTDVYYKGLWYCAGGKSRSENTITAVLKAKGVEVE